MGWLEGGGELEGPQRQGLHLVGGVGVVEGLGDAGHRVHDPAGGHVAAADEVVQDAGLLGVGEPQPLRHGA